MKKRYRDELEIVKDILQKLNEDPLLYSHISTKCNIGPKPLKYYLEQLLRLEWIVSEEVYINNWTPKRNKHIQFKITQLGRDQLIILSRLYNNWREEYVSPCVTY